MRFHYSLFFIYFLKFCVDPAAVVVDNAGKKEVEEILDRIEGSYDDAQVKVGLDELELRIKKETEDWKSNVTTIDARTNVLNLSEGQGH